MGFFLSTCTLNKNLSPTTGDSPPLPREQKKASNSPRTPRSVPMYGGGRGESLILGGERDLSVSFFTQNMKVGEAGSLARKNTFPKFVSTSTYRYTTASFKGSA